MSQKSLSQHENILLSPHLWGKWYEEHERWLEPFVFLGGFAFDNLTLRRIDKLLDILILFSWLILASLCIILLNVSRHKVFKGEFFEKAEEWAPILVQFSFGALFSGFTIFYLRSANIGTSWPFLAIVLFLFFGNEFFRKKYLRFNFQLVILFVAVYFLAILFLPVFIGAMGAWVFLLSGAIAIVMTGAFVHFLFRILPRSAREGERRLLKVVGGIFIAVNILYFTNILPPVPLALTNAGVFHLVSKPSTGGYVTEQEIWHWYDYFQIYQKVHLVPGQPLYFFSAVFAPTRLDTTIIHVWQHYDDVSGQWLEQGKISFPIIGGTDYGYRGYSEKTALAPGLWRVDVTTDRGQVLGRTRFEIISVPVEVPTIQVVQ